MDLPVFQLTHSSPKKESKKLFGAAEETPLKTDKIRRKLIFGIVSISVVLIGIQLVLIRDWLNMSTASIDGPVKQMVTQRGSLAFRQTQVVKKSLKWGRYDVDVCDAASRVGEIPGVTDVITASCVNEVFPKYDTQVFNCTGYTSNIVTDPCVLIKYLITLFKSTSDGQMYTGVGFEDGTNIFVSRDSGTNELVVAIRDAQNTFSMGTKYTVYGIDSSTGCLNTSDIRNTPSEYDCRARGWYSTTKSTNKPGWGTGAYADFATGALIITATKPIYAADGTTFIGSWLADVSMASVSQKLASIDYGSSGVGYVTELQDGVDMLVAASAGAIVEGETRLTPGQSSNSQIAESYQYLVERYGTNGNLGWGYSAYTVGDVLDGVPISAISPYTEITKSLPLNLVLTFPETDYSEFVLWSFYFTLVLEFFLLIVVLVMIVMAIRWRSTDDSDLMKQRLNYLLTFATIVIPSVLWVAWLVITKEYTDIVVEDALTSRTTAMAEAMTWSWEEYPFLHTLAIGEYIDGLLPFEANDPTTGAKGTTLDKHFADDLLLRGDGADYPQILFSYVGFQNGDLCGMAYICKYLAASISNGCSSRHDERIIAAVRNSHSNNHLMFYDTIADSSGTSLVRNASAMMKDEGPYSAITRPWYKQAVAAGKPDNSRYGYPIVTETFDYGPNQLVAVAQAFYDASGNLAGVVCMDTNMTEVTSLLSVLSPSTDSQGSAVERYGEVLGATNYQVSLPASNGGYRQLGVLNSQMLSLRSYATKLWQDEADFIKSQNDTQLEGTFVEVSASIGTYNTSWLFLPNRLSQWTTLLVVPRHVYFGELDDGTERNFVIVVFSLFTIGYAGWLLGAVVPQTSEQKKDCDTKMAAEEEYPGTPVAKAYIETVAMGVTSDHNEISATFSDCAPLSDSDFVTRHSLWRSFAKYELTARTLESVTTFREAATAIQSFGKSRDLTDSSLDKTLELDVDQFDPKDLAWESFVPDVDKETARKDVLLWNMALEDNIELLLKQWDIPAGDPQLQVRLQEKAIQMQRLRDKEIDPFVAIALEARTGQDSCMVKLFYFFEMPSVRLCLVSSRLLYQLGAFFTDDIFRRYWDYLAIVPYSAHSIYLYFRNRETFNGNHVEGITWVNLAFTVWLWIFQIFIAVAGLESDPSMQFVYNLIRPWMLITKSERLRCAFVVTRLSLAEASRTFFFLIFVIIVSALMFLILFEDKFDLELDGSVNSFLDSLVVTFIFLTSGENWDQFVYQGYAQDKMSFLLFVPLSFVGIIMLMSMVIATFEMTFSNHHDLLKKEPQILQWNASSLIFMMMTWQIPVEIDFLDGVLVKRLHLKASTDFGNVLLIAKVKGYKSNKPFRPEDFQGLIQPRVLIGDCVPEAQQLSDSIDAHHQTNDVMRSAVASLIVAQDVGDYHGLTLKEFAGVLVVLDAASYLCRNVLLSAKVMLARKEILASEVEERLLTCPDHEAEYRDELRVNYVQQQESLSKMRTYYETMHEAVLLSIGVSANLPMEKWNTVVMLVLGTYCSLLALSGSADSKSFYYGATAVLTALHALEVTMRIWLVRGLWGFFHDRRGFQRGFSNMVSLVVVSISSIAMVLYVILPDKYERVTQAIACIQLWRVLVLIPEYNEVTYSFLALGVPAITKFMWLLVIVMYVSCSVAHYMFDNVRNLDGSIDFTTLQDTWLTMYQVFIGEGWHTIMQEATASTNKACIWFFAGYVLIVGIVFTNLFVGVLINEFQNGTQKFSSIGGQVQLALKRALHDLPESHIRQLMLDMGHLALKMHFSEYADEHGADTIKYLQRWDARTSNADWDEGKNAESMTLEDITGHILLKRLRIKACRTNFLKVQKCGKSLEQRHCLRIQIVVGAVWATFRASGMNANSTITSDKQLMNMVQKCCEQYRELETPSVEHKVGQLTKEVQACIVLEMQHRLSSYMKLYNLRRMPKEQYMSYYGIPEPRKVPMTLLKFMSVFADSLVFAMSPHVLGEPENWRRLGRWINENRGDESTKRRPSLTGAASKVFLLPTARHQLQVQC